MCCAISLYRTHVNMGRISFVKLGGKVLYREEDVEKLLQENYRPRFEKP